MEAARWPSDTNMLSGGCPDLRHPHSPFFNRSQGYQFRALLLLAHRLRHGPKQQPVSGRHHDPMWQRQGPQIPTCHRMQPRHVTSQALEPDCFRITDSGCGRTLDTDIFTGHLGSDVTMAPSGSTGLSDWHGPRWWPRPQHWHSFDIISSYNINTDPGQDSTVAPGWCGFSGSMALQCQQDHRLWPRPPGFHVAFGGTMDHWHHYPGCGRLWT